MLSSLVRSRQLCVILAATAMLHFGLILLGLPSWQCPIRYGIGIPCPGCGLSRATLELLHGHFDHALRIHAFAPIAVGIGGLVLATIVLPKPHRIRLVRIVDRIEQRTGITIVLLSSSLIYWLIRLFFFTKEFYRLVL